MFVKAFPLAFVAARRAPNDRLAAIRWIAAARILLFPARLKQLRSLRFVPRYCSHTTPHDPLFFLTHHYYLSRYLTLAQRVDCAIIHYGYDSENYGHDYHRAVYESPHGLTLWRRVVDDTRYTLTLRATEDNRYEGDLSVLLLVNETRVGRMSFSYVNTALFGLEPERAMFITRNQTDRNPELQRFRDTFKQNSPPYFCLAAICGIAMANGMRAIFAIKDDAQIAYDERYAESFRNSYSGFWRVFGAEDIDQHCYRMPIPLQLRPLSDVKHRARAAARRRNWLGIIRNTRRTMLEDRTSSTPAAIEQPAASVDGETPPAIAGPRGDVDGGAARLHRADDRRLERTRNASR